MNTCPNCGKMKHSNMMQGCTCLYSMQAPPAAQQDEDDDTQGFMPDWANFQEGRKVGRAEAFERIAEKVKEMPWESDTQDSFLVWLKEQA